MISDKKFNTLIEDLCFKLPSTVSIFNFSLFFVAEFAMFYKYCRGLDFK